MDSEENTCSVFIKMKNQLDNNDIARIFQPFLLKTNLNIPYLLVRIYIKYPDRQKRKYNEFFFVLVFHITNITIA